MMKWRQSFPAAELLDSGLYLRKWNITATAPAAGRRILFFSDTHFRPDLLKNHRGKSSLKEWSGCEKIGNALLNAVNKIAPDVLIFGGDLVSCTCCYPQVFELISKLKAPVKLAVPGNWERKTDSWLPAEKVNAGFRDAGFQLLINRSVTSDGIQFSGVDDFRYGTPELPPADPGAAFRILISHNPDFIGKCNDPVISEYHAALCGHTHGGQIRIPFFGAVRTSSLYWKRFEYGICRRPGKPPTAVTAGIGGTYILHRFRCPPELLLITPG